MYVEQPQYARRDLAAALDYLESIKPNRRNEGRHFIALMKLSQAYFSVQRIAYFTCREAGGIQFSGRPANWRAILKALENETARAKRVVYSSRGGRGRATAHSDHVCWEEWISDIYVRALQEWGGFSPDGYTPLMKWGSRPVTDLASIQKP